MPTCPRGRGGAASTREPASFRRSGLSTTLKTQIRRRLAGRLGRNVSTLGPMLCGAALGGAVNRHETRQLAEAIREDLRRTRAHVERGQAVPDAERPSRTRLSAAANSSGRRVETYQ